MFRGCYGRTYANDSSRPRRIAARPRSPGVALAPVASRGRWADPSSRDAGTQKDQQGPLHLFLAMVVAKQAALVHWMALRWGGILMVYESPAHRTHCGA